MTKVAVVVLEVPDGMTVEDAIWQLRRSVALTEIVPTVTEEPVVVVAPGAVSPVPTEASVVESVVPAVPGTGMPDAPEVELVEPPVIEIAMRPNGRPAKERPDKPNKPDKERPPARNGA